jgi:GH25 family lysozyme M1 (1,4-beta-N-acetylmuramidase)
MNRQFGYIKSPFDRNDYNLRNFIPLGANLSLDEIAERNWEFRGDALDQKDTQHCLGFGMAHFGINLPVYTPYTEADAHAFYYMAKELEGDPQGENGAYARSAAEVLLNLKRIEAYAFAPDIATIKWWLLNRGCMMVGSMWLQGMMTPDAENKVYATGSNRGGHFYLINEWTCDNYIGIQNSWGKSWGQNGKAYISQTDFEKLFTYYGEAITAVELDDANVPVPEEPIEEPIEEPPIIVDPPVEPPIEPEPPIVVPPPTNKGCWTILASLLKNGYKELYGLNEQVLVHDVSKWQGDLSKYWQLFWDKGCRAIIIKATEGYAYYSYFTDTVKQAKDFGFLVGSYHYFRQQIQNTEGTWVTCDPVRQAQNYYDWIKKSGVVMDLPPAIDIENANNPYLSNTSIDKFLWKIEALTGRIPFIYSNPSILKGLAKAEWKRYPLWIANYASSPTIPSPWTDYTLWQFSDKITYTPAGSTAKKPIDHNWFNGTYEDLLAFCNAEAPVPPTPDPNAPRQVETITYLRGRTKPIYVFGDSALVYSPNTRLEVINEPEVYEAASGITWLPVRMWVSKGYVREV